MAVSAQRKMLIGLVNDLPEEQIPLILDYIIRNQFGYDEDEPPLTEDEIEGLKIAKQEIAEGKVIPLSKVMEELYE